jgi:cell wall-associated NlpC family hydrolase
VIVSGSPAPWKEVLAVYAVKTTTDDTEPLDAITLDSRRQQILREVHEDMSGIDYRTQERETYQVTLVEEADGTLIEETETVTVTTLYITYNALSADEAAVLYGFDAAQLSLLHDLLSPEYDSAWQATLYGLHSGSGEIVEVAASQIGNAGGQPYWSWYGFGSRVEWCATFVSWCANECGYIESGVIPKFAGCEWQGEAWFKERGQWQERGYEPQPGDIIFFDWNGDDISDHVGIVESTSGSVVYTIEGNNGDAVYRDSYSITSSVIAGYGLPQY